MTRTKVRLYNFHNTRWTSLRRFTRLVWLLNSQKKVPCSICLGARRIYRWRSLRRKIFRLRGFCWRGQCSRCWITRVATGVCCILGLRMGSSRCSRGWGPRRPTMTCLNWRKERPSLSWSSKIIRTSTPTTCPSFSRRAWHSPSKTTSNEALPYSARKTSRAKSYCSSKSNKNTSRSLWRKAV